MPKLINIPEIIPINIMSEFNEISDKVYRLDPQYSSANIAQYGDGLEIYFHSASLELWGRFEKILPRILMDTRRYLVRLSILSPFISRLPQEISTCNQITYIFISSKHFHQSIDDTTFTGGGITPLKLLKSFTIHTDIGRHGEVLSVFFPNSFTFPSLNEITFGSSRLTAKLPLIFDKMPNIKRLTLITMPRLRTLPRISPHFAMSNI